MDIQLQSSSCCEAMLEIYCSYTAGQIVSFHAMEVNGKRSRLRRKIAEKILAPPLLRNLKSSGSKGKRADKTPEKLKTKGIKNMKLKNRTCIWMLVTLSFDAHISRPQGKHSNFCTV